jgi:hypothetical protein
MLSSGCLGSLSVGFALVLSLCFASRLVFVLGVVVVVLLLVLADVAFHQVLDLQRVDIAALAVANLHGTKTHKD